MKTAVAFLGLGIMGSRMAANLVRAGFDVTVWNRTAATAAAFAAEHRVRVATSPAAAAAGAELIFTMVVDGPQVQAVLLGDGGAVHGAETGALCVDCSTIGPTWARQIGDGLRRAGLSLLDAPVTGSSPKAADGTLTFMAGGAAADLERARPALEAMGSLIVPAGGLGQGQMVKLLNNATAAINTAAVAQAFTLGARAGVDLDALQAVMEAGSGGSTMLALKGPVMRHHDWEPLFKLDHMLKDVTLCLQEAGSAGAPFPLAASVADLLSAASGRGLGDADFAALAEVVEAAAGARLTAEP
jgi:3-hydroxyisobutyrate dehydrogenase-like beta-hydroxyacid dehydrogenase